MSVKRSRVAGGMFEEFEPEPVTVAAETMPLFALDQQPVPATRDYGKATPPARMTNSVPMFDTQLVEGADGFLVLAAADDQD